jgi:fatty acid elongase 3
VILLTWVWLNEKLSFGVFGLLLNTGIHVFMYYYYFASGLGMNVWYKKYITTGQILQFVSLFALASYYLVLSKTNQCQEWGAFNLSIVVNASFLLLFVSFYRKTYNKKRVAVKK